MTEPVGKGKGGRDVYLGDIWPTSDEIQALLKYAMKGKAFRANYAKVATDPGKLWKKSRGERQCLHLACQHLHCRAAVFAHFLWMQELKTLVEWALKAKMMPNFPRSWRRA